jgi:DNA-binding NarL/FixJ family response regulator
MPVVQPGNFRHVVVVRSPQYAAALVDALRHVSWINAQIFDRLIDVPPNDRLRADSFLIWHEHLNRLTGVEARLLVRISRNATIIVLTNVETFLAALHTLQLGDAWLMIDLLSERVGDAIILAPEGYSIVPSKIGHLFGLDQLRARIADRLTSQERGVLAQLGMGSTNRQIALAFGVTETRAKSLVRSIMHKMQFINRTEAAVFVTRQGLS